jgi:hypothetical protein
MVKNDSAEEGRLTGQTLCGSCQVVSTQTNGEKNMKNLGLVFVAIFVAVTTPVLAWTNFNINAQTNTVNDDFSGYFGEGTVNYNIDTTGTDPWYNYETTGIIKNADWQSGYVQSNTQYTCPGVAGEAASGTATAGAWVGTDGTGSVDINAYANPSAPGIRSNFAGMSVATMSLVADADGEGTYGMGVSLQETSNVNQFSYGLSGDGTGEIKFGNMAYSAQPNWGDSGSVSLSKWEYNWAQATGAGSFSEFLQGEDYLQNKAYTLPGGGTINSNVVFDDGMSKTSLWMTAY